MPEGARLADSIATIMAVGVVAYVGETLMHEAIGHGGVCLLTGGHVSVLAPLWMRCSVVTSGMVAAGPLGNFAAAIIFGLWLRLVPPGPASVRLFLWLSASFNALVANGYLCVGGATGFGDWGVLLADARPVWLWHSGLLLLGVSGFYASLRVLARLYVGAQGAGRLAWPRLVRRTLVPAAAASVVACGAELAGGRFGAAPLGLALGCTLGVGFALSRIGDFPAGEQISGGLGDGIALSWGWVAGGLVAAGAFAGVVGPGLVLG